MTATDFISQDTLWDSQVVVKQKRPSIEDRFNAFRREHPYFMKRFYEVAREDQLRGATRGSAKKYFELLREEVEKRGGRYALNNDFTALASRLAMEWWPEMDGFFELRVRKSA